MWEGMVEVFTATDFWGIVIKVLVTAVLTGLVGLCATLIGKLIAKCKNSKIYKYAKTCVEAAEQKFPNEGTKMGPEKMQYVMDQLAIAFPKIKDNRFLYNVAEAAVYQLNEEKRQEAAILEFKEKYGEDPLAVSSTKTELVEEKPSKVEEEVKETSKASIIDSPVKPVKKNKFTSF